LSALSWQKWKYWSCVIGTTGDRRMLISGKSTAAGGFVVGRIAVLICNFLSGRLFSYQLTAISLQPPAKNNDTRERLFAWLKAES
jgi:hypothetical protein